MGFTGLMVDEVWRSQDLRFMGFIGSAGLGVYGL